MNKQIIRTYGKNDTHSDALTVKQISKPLACLPPVEVVDEREVGTGEDLHKRKNFVVARATLTPEEGNLINREHAAVKLGE